MNTVRIHWLGAGLSSGPGIRKIAQSGRTLILWNRTLKKAQAALGGIEKPACVSVLPFTLKEFQSTLMPGDIVVSMLPANMHPEIAELCLAKKNHQVTTSYISDAMRAYHDEALKLDLSFINESGLDPGLDHLLAHQLMHEYKQSKEFSPENYLSFKSYCGGFPKHPGPFRYKFSWSPIGVLRALKNQARFIANGKEKCVNQPWEALTSFTLAGEMFEVYPNRDSIPYVQEYGFEPSWNIDSFVRGTIRPEGWSHAWAHLFEKLHDATPEELESLSQELWKKHAYLEGEHDRVILFVSLEAKRDSKKIWSRSYSLDESGVGRDTAMARLVSLPATFAVESIEKGLAPKGVCGAPKMMEEIERWISGLAKEKVNLISRINV